MEVTPLHVLHLEPDDAIASHVAAALARSGTQFEVVRAASRESGIRYLIDQPFDAALVSLEASTEPATMEPGEVEPGAREPNDAEFIRDVVVHAPEAAIVACTARPGDQLGSTCLRAGASDVVHVEDLSSRMLERVLRFAVDRKAYERSIRALTTTDDLTEVGNRRALNDWHRAATNKLTRQGGMIVVGVVDLDDFKSVNDRHGHQTGDDVLRETAQRLAGAFRPDDAAVRLGGDEFAIVVHSPAPDAVAAVRSRVQAALATPPIEVAGRTVRASIGFVATDDPTRPVTDLLHIADAAMYEQKRHAR